MKALILPIGLVSVLLLSGCGGTVMKTNEPQKGTQISTTNTAQITSNSVTSQNDNNENESVGIVVDFPKDQTVFQLPLPKSASNRITVSGRIYGHLESDAKIDIKFYGGESIDSEFDQHYMYGFDYPVNPDGTFKVDYPIGRLVQFPTAKPNYYTLLLEYPNVPSKTVTIIMRRPPGSNEFPPEVK